MHPSILVNCFSILHNPASTDWPPLHEHTVVSIGAIRLDKKPPKIYLAASLKKDGEGKLLEGLGDFLTSGVLPTTQVVTMYGRSYTIPLLLQQAMVHKVPLPALAGLVQGPTPRNWVDLLDLLTNYGASKFPKTDDVFERVLDLPGPHKPDVEKLARGKIKGVKSAQVLYLAKLTLLWMRQCVVTGSLTRKEAKKLFASVAETLIDLEPKEKGKKELRKILTAGR